MKRSRRIALGAAVMLAIVAPLAAHWGVERAGRIEPPALQIDKPASRQANGTRFVGDSYVRRVGNLTEVRLVGGPEAMGYAHGRLLHSEMIETERVVWELLDDNVPSRLARLLLLDVAQWAYRDVDRGMSKTRRREIAAKALAFDPDPFTGYFPTFQRFVYLQALYDISLAFEHSPLIGCTTFTFSGQGTPDSPTLLARAFDFEAHDVFDERKAVFLVFEEGRIPYASVAWPGLVGVLSGMNREGLAVVVHGARAGEPQSTGEPVVHSLRRVLGRAKTVDEALKLLGDRDVMVSHIVVVTDASGRSVAIERVPGTPPFARDLGRAGAVTNHLEGPQQAAPANRRVKEGTSTVDRRRRGDELVASRRGGAVGAADAVGLLRDRSGPGGAKLPLGDRRAIDALIATHGVVMDCTTRTLWVSEGPHLLGRFVSFDLNRLLDRGYQPSRIERPTIAADASLSVARYQEWRARQAQP